MERGKVCFFPECIENIHTTATADSWRMVKILVMKINDFGTRFWPLCVKLLRMRPSALFPNAQYPEMATLKKVVDSMA